MLPLRQIHEKVPFPFPARSGSLNLEFLFENIIDARRSCPACRVATVVGRAGPARRRATRRSRVGTPQRRAARVRHATQAKFVVAPARRWRGGQGFAPHLAPARPGSTPATRCNLEI